MENKNYLLNQYFRDVRKYPLIKSKKIEKELIEKAKTGDKNSLNKIVTSNLLYAASIAKEYCYQNLGLDTIDLISCANEGLIKAVKKFDTKRDNAFLSYADYWIRQSIRSEIIETSRIVREPESVVRKKVKERKKQIKEIREENDFIYTDLIDIYQQTVSLNSHICDDDSSIELIDNVTSNYSIYNDIDLNIDNINKDKNDEKIENALNILTKNERYVIERIFGFKTQEAHSFSELSQEINLSIVRVKAIYNNAIKKLRCYVLENEIC